METVAESHDLVIERILRYYPMSAVKIRALSWSTAANMSFLERVLAWPTARRKNHAARHRIYVKRPVPRGVLPTQR